MKPESIASIIAAIGISLSLSCSSNDNDGPSDVQPEPPTIASFTADPAKIHAGDASTLAWQVTGADSLSLAPGIGTVTGTSRSVSPTTTTTYTLTARNSAGVVTRDATVTVLPDGAVRIVFLHHSTGGLIWDAGVSAWFDAYNSEQGTDYQIVDLAYPDSPYPWENYPYDYWHLWVDPQSPANDTEPGVYSLNRIAADQDVIVFKHCFPVSAMEPDDACDPPDVASDIKTDGNYRLQYAALKTRLRQFPSKKFLLWTGAALTEEETTPEAAERARQFFTWVKGTWDETGDNIFLFDFRELETEGGLYLRPDYAADPHDPHPNEAFSQTVAPRFAQRVVDVIEGRGDTGSLTGS